MVSSQYDVTILPGVAIRVHVYNFPLKLLVYGLSPVGGVYAFASRTC